MIIVKGLTVCQPYAHLIALPDSDPRAKRIENRTWSTPYRGHLLIHAGKSTAWLDDDDELEYPRMAFGAAVALARLADCVPLSRVPEHLKGSPHALGPVCWVLEDVQALARPIPWRGAQGLWYVEPALLEELQRLIPFGPQMVMPS